MPNTQALRPVRSGPLSLARGPARFDVSLARGPARFDVSLARGPARFDVSLARGPVRFGLASSALFVAFLVLASSAFAQAQAPAPAPAPAAPPPGSPAAVQAPPPAPGTVQYAQPAPAPYYGQQQYPQQQYPQQQYPQQQPYAGQQPYAQPVYAPPPNYAPPQPRYRPRRGLLVGGIAMFGGSYLFTAISGGIMMDISRLDCRHCQDVGPLLLIPVAGPFIAISEATSGEAFLVLSGLVQIGGLAMIVIGAIQYSASKKRAQQQGLLTFGLPEGRALSLDLSATPLRLGPTAQLRF